MSVVADIRRNGKYSSSCNCRVTEKNLNNFMQVNKEETETVLTLKIHQMELNKVEGEKFIFIFSSVQWRI